MSTTTSGGSGHQGHAVKPVSNSVSGVLGVVSFLTAPSMGGGVSSATSGRRVCTDDSCAVDSMRQRSSSTDRPSTAGSQRVATVSTLLAPPPVPAPFRLPRARVTWTPDLRRRFDKALELVGGIRVATPTAVLDAMTASAEAQGVVLPLSRQSVASFLQRQRKRCRDAPVEWAPACGVVGSAVGLAGNGTVDMAPAPSLAGCGTPLFVSPASPWS